MPSKILIAVASCALAACDAYHGQCDVIHADGTAFTEEVAAAHDPIAGTTVLAWEQSEFGAQGADSGLRFGVLAADGSFTPAGTVEIGSKSHLITTTIATDGGLLVLLENWWVLVDANGSVIRDDLVLPGGHVQGVGVPGGFLLAYGTQPPASYNYDLGLIQVGLDGSMRDLGTVAQSQGWFGVARIGDRVWLAYTSVEGATAALRLDLGGNVVDAWDLGTDELAAIAGAGDRGMVFEDDGTAIPLGASGPGAPIAHPGLNAYGVSIGVPGHGYLAGQTWVDLDGAVVGTLGLPDAGVLGTTTIGDDVMLVWTVFPQTISVGTWPSRLLTTTIAFGADQLPPPVERLSAVVTGVAGHADCPDYGND
jgi:hypothetical protein